MSTELIISIAIAVSTLLGAGFAVHKFLRPVFQRIGKWMTTWEQFLNDWAGEEARPGRSRVPGVMERLNNIDGQLKHNGGSSIKDAVDRIETRLIKGDNKFDELSQRVSNLEDRLEE